jgi:integrase
LPPDCHPGAFRRSELVALNVDDIEPAAEGLVVTIRRSKTDQEAIGRKVAIPRGDIACPVAALAAWRIAAGIHDGPLFRRVWNRLDQRVGADRLSARMVATIVQDAAERVGLDPATFGAHSLRAGFITSAAKRGANLFKICDTRGHKSLEMLRTYVRDAELFANHAGAGLLYAERASLDALGCHVRCRSSNRHADGSRLCGRCRTY